MIESKFLLLKIVKYVLKYIIRVIQIALFICIVAASIYSIYLLLYKVGYPLGKYIFNIDLKGDLLINGIPVLTSILLIFMGIMFIILLRLPIYLCCVLLMLINGSLGDIIEYLNVTGKNNYPYLLVFEEGKLIIILKNKQATRRRFLLRWRTYF